MAAKQLYQLESTYQLSPGAYVAVNGPWDTFGRVQSSTLRPNGKYLNVIRGCEKVAGEKPVASW